MYTVDSYETNTPHLHFFHKESTDVALLRFKSAMRLSNLFLFKATFTVFVLVFSGSYIVHIDFQPLGLESDCNI
jgi:hypothetical protein